MADNPAKNRDASEGQYYIHQVLERNFKSCLHCLDEFISKKVTSLNTTIGNRAVTQSLPVLFEYLYQVLVLLEEHHWHEEHIWFPLVRKHLPKVEEQLKSFEDDHKKFVEDWSKLDKLLKEKIQHHDLDFQGVEDIRTLWNQILQFILPHFHKEEEVLSREVVKIIPTEEWKNAELEIQKHARAGPKSHLRLAIIFYSLDSQERQIFFHTAPAFLIKVVVPRFLWFGYRHFIPFFTSYT